MSYRYQLGLTGLLGYFSVSFGFGIFCINLGLSVLAAAGISLTNLTSAGQVAGVGIIAAGGTLIEMVMTQLVINLRYSLFAISLSQKLDSSFTTPHRIAASFGITDEIFAVTYAQEGKVKPAYMYGVILISALGWVGGTALGAAMGVQGRLSRSTELSQSSISRRRRIRLRRISGPTPYTACSRLST